MKKIIFILIAALAFCANAMADGECATLQHDGKIKAFYGEEALYQAQLEAEDGDVIMLSKGKFTKWRAIDKSITLIGTYGFSRDPAVATVLGELNQGMSVTANDVHIEGIHISNLLLGNIENCIVRRCWCNLDIPGYGHSDTKYVNKNTIVDQCHGACQAIYNGENFTLKNSIVDYFGSRESIPEHKANIMNCVIGTWPYYQSYDKTTYAVPYGIYKNNIIGVDPEVCSGVTLESKVINNKQTYRSKYPFKVPEVGEFYYNCFFIRNHRETVTDSWGHNWTNTEDLVVPNFTSKTLNSGNTGTGMYELFGIKEVNELNYKFWNNPWFYYNSSEAGKGDDGTTKGWSGGTGVSSYPSIPRITSSEIDSNTDKEGKLKVKITVKTR